MVHTEAMSLPDELAALFRRDLTRLVQQIEAFPDASALWRIAPGITNSAGNLALHVEGNLREYIGRQLGGVPYQRQREQEFLAASLTANDLVRRIESLRDLVTSAVSSLSTQRLEEKHPEIVFGAARSTQQYLVHLHGHLNYHLGQIDYVRRFLTSGTPVQFVGL
jgi:uncharacterized damage-inducible protein DinB